MAVANKRKYNYFEFREAYHPQVDAVTGSPADSEILLMNAFREAADAVLEPRAIAIRAVHLVANVFGYLGGGALGAHIFTPSAHAFLSSVGATPVVCIGAIAGAFVMTTAIENVIDQEHPFTRQFSSVKEGGAVLPDAKGNKNMYRDACDIVDEWLVAHRAPVSLATGGAASTPAP